MYLYYNYILIIVVIKVSLPIQRWGQKHRKEKDKQRNISWYNTSTPATVLPKSSGLWPLAVLILLSIYTFEMLHPSYLAKVSKYKCGHHFLGTYIKARKGLSYINMYKNMTKYKILPGSILSLHVSSIIHRHKNCIYAHTNMSTSSDPHVHANAQQSTCQTSHSSTNMTKTQHHDHKWSTYRR